MDELSEVEEPKDETEEVEEENNEKSGAFFSNTVYRNMSLVIIINLRGRYLTYGEGAIC